MVSLTARLEMGKSKLLPGLLLFWLIIGSQGLQDGETLTAEKSLTPPQDESEQTGPRDSVNIVDQLQSGSLSQRTAEKLPGGNLNSMSDAGRLDGDDLEGEGEAGLSLTSYGPVSSPFYFMCHYPRPGEPTGIGRAEVTIKVELSGAETNPPLYEPHAVYQVLVTSSVPLDGFMLTGIHALTKTLSESSHINMPASLHGGATKGLLCTILHSHISHKPRRSLSFLWMAPPSGSGCVNFLAQGTLGEQLLFKDLPILEVCEKESSVAEFRLKESLLTGTDLPGFVFRDDFESQRLESSIWDGIVGGSVGNHQRFFTGSAATFDDHHSEMTSRPMDFSRAKHLHFTLGSNCSPAGEIELSFGSMRELKAIRTTEDASDQDVVGLMKEGSDDPVSSRTHEGSDVSGNDTRDQILTRTSDGLDDSHMDDSGCIFWEKVHSYRLDNSHEIHMRTIPPRFKQPGVCLRWSMTSSDDSNGTCWGIDNVAVTTADVTSEPIYDDFDPVDPSNWFFIHGNKIQESCGSEGNSMVFLGGKISTRSMDLKTLPSDDDIILEHYFLHESPPGWQLQGGSVERCGDLRRLVFSGEGVRRVCTPSFDAKNAGVIGLTMQIGECSAAFSGNEIRVSIYAEKGSRKVPLREYALTYSSAIFTIPIEDSHNLVEDTRICVEQTVFGKKDTDVWVLDHIRLLPWLPTNPRHYLQARVNLECGKGASEVEVETSSDDALTWVPLHRRCLPAWCDRQHSAFSSSLRTQEFDRWELVTFPLPYFSLTPHTRFRFRNVNGNTSNSDVTENSWAIDNVFIGACNTGCSKHGLCQPDGTCKCEYGYSGAACEHPDHENPFYMSEPFSDSIASSANILKVTGGRSSMRCGVVGAGNAAVFLGGGPRSITTVDLNTTQAHFLQFHFLAGTISEVGKCPGPDHVSESVYVHYSCNGGMSWNLLHTLSAAKHKESSHISLDLPPASRAPAVDPDLAGPQHQGMAKTCGPLIDLTVTSQIFFNNIQLDFSDSEAVNNSLRFHLGELGGGVCGRDSSIVFDNMISSGASRFIETKSVGVGPSYMMQFDLVIGCGGAMDQDISNKIVLEYSLNHGMTWFLVHRPCSPSIPGCGTHFSRGTVYEHSEFKDWNRVTLRLPRHTWSPTTRLRLRQTEDSEVSESWAVDNLYIGRQCPGLCSGHGHCTLQGCSCDDDFHGRECLPLHKLRHQIETSFDEESDLAAYNIQVIGGTIVEGEDGCGQVLSKKNLYFGAPGIRQFETDDLNAEDLGIIQFMLIIGSGRKSSCIPADEEEKLNAGSVVVEYSNDGGISWEFFLELLPSQYRSPRLFHSKLEKRHVEAGVVRFRIWQPIHDGQNQWAIDNLRIAPDFQLNSMQADFAEGSNIISPWMSITSNRYGRYCNSEDIAQVIDGEEPLRLAMTGPLNLNINDIISFQISVGCKDEFSSEEYPVMLQFSKDGGISWHLVDEGCSSSALHCNGPREPSIYRAGHHGPWSRILLPVDHRLAPGTVQLRWFQNNPGETKDGEFALRNLYIGPPCIRNCHGHGMCTAAGHCKCDTGYNGTYCGRSKTSKPRWMYDDFEDSTEVSSMWENTEGAKVAVGCGSQPTGNSLLFSSSGPRFATTKELDTRSIKYLTFSLQIGSPVSSGRCQQGIVPRDNVILQHSPDNGQLWHTLQLFEPFQTTNRHEAFFIPLPDSARTRQTRFRWWQDYNDMMKDDNSFQEERAEWHLDNVMVLANETLPTFLFDTFDGNASRALPWFLTAGSHIDQDCGSKDAVMLFPSHTGPKYAETWDFEASESSVIQFDFQIGCHQSSSDGEVSLQYSLDHGKKWQLVKELCAPPQLECDTFHLPTTYTISNTPSWTRHTVTLPKKTIGESTRLRLISKGHGTNMGKTASWAIDNFYAGNSCPWMCSGHGYCLNGECRCDEGFFGPFCVPASVLPCELMDTFIDPQLSTLKWLEAYGSEVSQRCGILVSKSALVFFKGGLRLATTVDLDMTSDSFIQFNLQMGCKNQQSIEQTFRRNSNGERFHSHPEIHYQETSRPISISINLGDFPDVQQNATRFRLWQPRHEGVMMQAWAIDNIFIGGMPVTPNVLYEDFNKGSPMEDVWTDWPAGEVGVLCDKSDSNSGLIFEGTEEGEHAAYTRDIAVNENSIVQFDIRVGCGDVTARDHNVSLQYSSDFGQSWTTVRPTTDLPSSSPDCLHDLQTPTVYYPNSATKWRRHVIPLQGLPICGPVRFRWIQGHYQGKEKAVPWGIDNVYIGPSCPHHCSGHGYCVNGDRCFCDDRFEGQVDCALSEQLPQTLHEGFEGNSLSDQFEVWSGAEISRFCGVLTDDALVFNQQGERMLMTTNLDLSQGSFVQFYIRFGCLPDDMATEDGPVLLQFSTDGGISWTLLAELGRNPRQQLQGIPHTKYITLALPDSSRSNTTRLRWWQTSKDGSFSSQWAIDQIHIGNTVQGLPAFTDIDTGSSWLLRPGSQMEPICGTSHSSVHFTGREGYRFAETPDILINRHSFIQFTAALGCKESLACFEVKLEYSTDQGSTWWPLKESCLPSDPDCTEYWPSSILTSDLHTRPSQITMPLNPKTRDTMARIRFNQQDYRQQHTWSLSHVYIGDECYGMCSGRGFCDAGICHCQQGWTDDSCSTPERALPTFLVSENDAEVDPSPWQKVVGAQITGQCGVIASGEALHFTGGCSRYLETVDLDLRETMFIQFDIRTGCLDPVSGRDAGGDHSILIQTSCDAGISWTTLKKLLLIYQQPVYVWLRLPDEAHCLGGRVRWWQPGGGESNRYDWAIDSIIIGGNVTPPDSISYTKTHQLQPPLWLRKYNAKIGNYCENKFAMHVMMSTASEPALIETTDLQIEKNHSINFLLALGCGATWDSTAEPVRLEYSLDFGNHWKLVREMCLPGSNRCSELTDESIFYAPVNWNRYVFPLDHIGPAKYVRFRWIQKPTADISGSHQWSLRDVFIGVSCPQHCLGRGSCLQGICHCEAGYAGTYCQHILKENVPFIRDEFTQNVFLPHFSQVQGGLLSGGCGLLEEPPTATFQGPRIRMLQTIPVDSRSIKFVHFIAQIGSPHGIKICRKASHRHHNVFLQYSVDGGIRWQLLRELDYRLYTTPNEEYILIPPEARSPATSFRFWQPQLGTPSPAWSLDNVYIGGSEISPARLMDKFEEEPTISEWLFAPHGVNQQEFCSAGTNGSLVWNADSPGHRAITSQEVIINEGHVLQFKLAIGCGEPDSKCGDENSGIRLEYSLDGGVTGWDLVMDSCLPGTSPDPDCMPYTFHYQSVFNTDVYSQWTRITIPLPEKTWSSSTQLRWVQDVPGRGSQVTPWSLDDVYIGEACPEHCHGHGDCVNGRCICDTGFTGDFCEPVPSRTSPLPTSLIDGFEAGSKVNWLRVTGGGIGLGCNSLSPYGHGKHLYFSACGTRQAITKELDTRRASKIMFVLRIGSQDKTPSCHVDLSNPQRALDKGIILQYTINNGVTWTTINVHDPVDFGKARRVAYSLPYEARRYGLQLRWWQPYHDGANRDQWALDNVEVVLAQRKDTNKYEAQVFHDSEL
ncbi:LOW QUALITY PROTEIN: reelin-like [Macrobrachium nipponense]|uniref:LOW QUALITY PROTEIN: reelin-like n=1 Tax=Macrobrachium nipponense TaxID=159736 RepID=UPI0030C7FB6B